MTTDIIAAVDTSVAITQQTSISDGLYQETLCIIRLCEQELSRIISEVNDNLLPSLLPSNDATQYQTHFRDVIESVERLELRMAIVGPIKSGKSTILNAIMGDDLLPSRNTAMTTLPTEILFSQHIKQPQLILKPELITTINEINRQLRLKCNERNLEIRFQKQDDLIESMKKISTNEMMILQETTSEKSKIVESLKFINDILRISIILNIEKSINCTWIPRLKVPLPHSLSIPQGEFIIIDTPGPNDSRLSAHLRQIVISELQKATLILIAVEFIGLDSTDEATLQKDIQTICEYRNTNNSSYLYGLVNKIDQRIEGKHNSIETTKTAIANRYKMSLTNVYEISALNAILSYRFLHEYEHLKKRSKVTYEILMNEMVSYSMFMQQAMGQEWKLLAQHIDVNMLPIIAKSLWEKSNYDSFLCNVLHMVTQRVMPTCLNEALDKCYYYIKMYYDKTKIRKSCLNIDEKPLLENIRLLEEDKRQLNSKQKDATNVLNDYHNNIVGKIRQSFDDLKGECADSVREILDDQSTQHSRSHWKKLLRGKNVLHFQAEDETEVFLETFFNSVKEISTEKMYSLNRSINQKISDACSEFEAQLQSMTVDTCKRVGLRLKLLLGVDIIHLEGSSNPLNMFHLFKALKETELPVRRRVWYFLWLVKRTYKIKVNEISKKQLEHAALDALRENFEELEQKTVVESKARISTVYKSHFEAIEWLLSELCNNLQAAIDDKKIEREGIEAKFDLILSKLDQTMQEVNNKKTKIDRYYKD